MLIGVNVSVFFPNCLAVIWGLQEILYFLTKLRQIAFCWQRLRGFYPLYTKAVVRISDNIILQQGIGRKPVNNIGQIKKKL